MGGGTENNMSKGNNKQRTSQAKKGKGGYRKDTLNETQRCTIKTILTPAFQKASADEVAEVGLLSKGTHHVRIQPYEMRLFPKEGTNPYLANACRILHMKR